LHTPAVHVAAAFAPPHTTPQPPQFFTSPARVDSQPFAALPSQSPKPLPQIVLHTPASHVGVPLVPRHTTPQPPQFFTSFVRPVSQPLDTVRSQSPKPGLHTMAHAPVAQLGVPLFDEHATPQPPQFFTSASVRVSHPFITLPSQSPYVGMHAIRHCPERQVERPLAVEHFTPHPPQFVTSDAVPTSHPVAALPSQSR
jgi:hypothetical protein